MKRSYTEMSTIPLPVWSRDDPRKFKSTLEGSYKLRVISVQDISKPKAKPIDDIDEPENEEEANETRLNKSNARMLQFDLKDSNNTEIRALETEHISELNDLNVNWYIYIQGPVEVRCGNIMLQKKHITGKARLTQEEITLLSPQAEIHEHVSADEQASVVTIDDHTVPSSVLLATQRSAEVAAQMAEDWDDGDDDCITIT